MKAGPSEKSQANSNGLSLATERRRVFAELIESDPEEALRQAVPARLREQLPADIVALLEEQVSGYGDFNVIATLPVPGAEKSVRPIERFAILESKRYQAFVYGRQLTQITRTNVPLRGVAIDGKLALEDNTQLKDGDGSRPKSAWTFGIKNALFMRVNFPDDLEEPISMAGAVSLMNSVSNFFDEVSYHNTGMRATVTPLLTMPNPKSFYQAINQPFGLVQDARSVAASNGFNTANFDLDCVIFKSMFPGANAMAFVGAKGLWMQVADAGIASHEFGHNYGLFHANFWTANDDTIIGPGTNEEYGNTFDTMGISTSIGPYQFNACHKNRLDWLPDANVATITTSGVYRIYAFDAATLNGNLFYALKVKKDERNYWGELRSRFTQNEFIFNGLMLNWSPWLQSNGGTQLLDTTPGTDFNKNDCTVTIGRTFSDPFAGIHLTPIRVNSNTVPRSIDVVANLGRFPDNHSPTVTLSASPTSVAINEPVTLTATASDPDGDTLAYDWEFRDVIPAVGTNGSVAVKSWTAAGDYVVRCIVSDMKGGTAIARVLITVGSPTGFRISGRVLNGSTPVENARVFGVIFNAYTDSNGDYIMTGMSPGDYSLYAYKPGWTMTPANFANPVTVGPSQSNVNFTATPTTYNISGSALYRNLALSGATVTLQGTNSTVTDGNGFYLFSNVRAGVYDLTSSKPGYDLRPMNFSNPVGVDWQNIVNKNFNAQLALLLTQMRATNGGFAFRLSGDPNQVIRIEASTNFANWISLATVTNTTGQMDFADAPFSTPRRFYRAAILP